MLARQAKAQAWSKTSEASPNQPRSRGRSMNESGALAASGGQWAQRVRRLACAVGAFTSIAWWTRTSPALELEVAETPSVVGVEHVFNAVVTDATGEVSFEWRFGDAGDFVAGGAAMPNVFSEAGHFSVEVVATDENGDSASAYFLHLVHHPLTADKPSAASSIIYDSVRNRIYTANQDNDSISVIDPEALTKLAELPVYQNPESLALTPEGKLWVLHRDDYAMAVVDLDQLVVERGFRLPYASQPIALAMSPTKDAAYVSLMALGRLLKLHPETGEVLGQVDVGPRPRGVAVSHDGADVYVSRFVSPNSGGEVVRVSTDTMSVAARIVLRVDSETIDSDLQARGLPNYLFAVALTPDGRQAWVPGKSDNILRGVLRDGQDLTHDTTVRPLTAIIDTGSDEEIFQSRFDLDDRSMPVHAVFTPYGNFAILTLAGSNRIEVREVYRPGQVFSAIADAGVFPRASVLTPGGVLFVQGSLSRSVLAYDMSALLNDYDSSSPPLLGEVATVESEQLSPEVLLGKQLFHNAEDTRMGLEGYLSCGACHFEGLEDGRVWDFSTLGEGLRNTVALLGRPSQEHGRLNWSANVDEVQDFERQIRLLFKGVGFLPDEIYLEGTRSEPLGDPLAGLSPELDALAAYVASLDRVNPSPYRNPDGSLTPDGEAGQALFLKLGCDFCHAGAGFTDSPRGTLHDVGTLSELSGERAGDLLFGIDTPTLLGVWETAPYLHDGSAASLRDVLTTRNVDDLHGYVSILSEAELDQLVAYLEQIDEGLPVRRLPFEPPLPTTTTDGSGGMSTSSSGGSTGGVGGASGSANGNSVTATSGSTASQGTASKSGCTCRAAGSEQSQAPLSFTTGALLLLGLLARGRGRGRGVFGGSS